VYKRQGKRCSVQNSLAIHFAAPSVKIAHPRRH
jgi:hypothetical protein